MKFSRGVTLQLNFATTNRVIVPILNGLKRAGGVYNSATGAPYITGVGRACDAPHRHQHQGERHRQHAGVVVAG